MTEQRPLGPPELVCPFHRQSMVKVCHKCPLWTKLVMKDPQSQKEIDKWDCAIAWAVIVGVEGSQRTNQVAAAIEDTRNNLMVGVAGLASAVVGSRPGPKLVSEK